MPAQKNMYGERVGKSGRERGESLNEWKRSQKGLESCCSESRSSGNELSLRSMTALCSPQSTRAQQAMGKEQSLRRLEERRKWREKSREEKKK